MRNNIALLIIIFIFQSTNMAFSESFFLKSQNIEILKEGEVINAYKGTAISNDKNLEIVSDKFIYLKNLDILKSIGNGLAKIKSEKIEIKYDSAIFDQKNLNIKANNNVEIFQKDGGYIIKNDEIFFRPKKKYYKFR